VALLGVAVVIQATALWWRRSHPRTVLLVIVAVQIVTMFAATEREPLGLGLAFAVYAVSMYDQSRARLLVAAAAMGLILVAVVLLVFGVLPTARILIPPGATSLVAWVIGDYRRSRRQFVMDLVARHQKEREQAAEEERLRIARELHDVVAHNVSLMAIQAGAARVSGAPAESTLASIEQSARDTLSELNKMVGVLRKGPGGGDRVPQPSLDEVDSLLNSAREAGLQATLKVTGDRSPLPSAVELSAYRIVQEAITNVLKHAHATRLEVTIDHRPEELLLAVTDNGSGPRDALVASTGHGLIGMRERVDLFGGDLSTGSSSLGGFTVRARLPLA
jgi:signal transduction histidine kinase